MRQKRQQKKIALLMWQLLPIEQRKELYEQAVRRQEEKQDTQVILFDTSKKEPTASVASFMWETDVSEGAMNDWLYIRDIPKEEGVTDGGTTGTDPA